MYTFVIHSLDYNKALTNKVHENYFVNKESFPLTINGRHIEELLYCIKIGE